MKINWLHWLNFKQKYNLCLNTDDTLAVYQLGWLQPLEAGWDQPDEAGAGAHPDETGAGADCVMTWKYWKCLEWCREQKKFLVKKNTTKIHSLWWFEHELVELELDERNQHQWPTKNYQTLNNTFAFRFYIHRNYQYVLKYKRIVPQSNAHLNFEMQKNRTHFNCTVRQRTICGIWNISFLICLYVIWIKMMSYIYLDYFNWSWTMAGMAIMAGVWITLNMDYFDNLIWLMMVCARWTTTWWPSAWSTWSSIDIDNFNYFWAWWSAASQ